MSQVKILIAASGSGGHLFPALHIARALREECADIQIEFVGTGRPLEVKLIDGAGYRRHEIKLGGIVGRGFLGVLQFLFQFPKAFIKNWKLLSEFQPDLVIGVGGYASFFPVSVAMLRGIPTWIHEAEINPGLTNKILAPFVTRASVGFDRSTMLRRSIEFTGHPVRPELASVKLCNPDGGRPRHLLILGGSQGAKALDEAVSSIAPILKSYGVEVWHQTRPESASEVQKAYEQGGVKAKVEPFISDMVAAYEWSDLIISRSGAASVTEISIVGRPAIFVPLPSSQGGHQTINAKLLVDGGKAVMVEQGAEFSEKLRAELENLLTGEKYSKLLRHEFSKRPIDAARRIARGCLGLCGR